MKERRRKSFKMWYFLSDVHFSRCLWAAPAHYLSINLFVWLHMYLPASSHKSSFRWDRSRVGDTYLGYICDVWMNGFEWNGNVYVYHRRDTISWCLFRFGHPVNFNLTDIFKMAPCQIIKTLLSISLQSRYTLFAYSWLTTSAYWRANQQNEYSYIDSKSVFQ